MSSFDDYIVFVDESGDHGMETIDPHYPMFVLVFCVFGKEDYAARLAPAMLRFKFRHFGHDQVVLHEMDIRKSRGAVGFLRDAARRSVFMDDVNELVKNAPFTLVASAIHKQRYQAQYRAPGNPYHVAMTFGLERIYSMLQGEGCAGGITHMIFERRGQREDAEVELEFRRICDGANYFGAHLPFQIILSNKQCNSSGLQLADLIARPIGRHLLEPDQPNRAYEIVERKFRRSPAGKIRGWGLKVFP